MKYNLDDKPGFSAMLLYGVQWWIVSLPSMIIIGTVVSKAHYADLSLQTLYMQKLFAIMGLTTIVQILWGHKLPLIVGPASVLLIGIMASLSSGISAIYTSIGLGGVVLAFTAWSGLLHKLHRVFTPRVIAVILMLIAFSLMPVILGLVLHNSNHSLLNLFFSLGLVFSLVLGNKYLRGIAKATTLLWGILLGSLAYHFLLGGESSIPYVNTLAANEPFLFLPSLVFDPGTLLSFLFCFIALMINEIGSVEAVAHMLQADSVEKRMRKGVIVLGFSNMLSGATGVIGSVDYSLSTGIIAATQCASRYTFLPTGVALFACAFFPKFIHLLTVIPDPVMGALLLHLMSSQLATGLSMVVKEKSIHNFSSGLIVALPLLLTLLIAYTPGEVFSEGSPLLRPIIGNGFIMGCISVLLLEHVVFRNSDS